MVCNFSSHIYIKVYNESLLQILNALIYYKPKLDKFKY